MFRKGKKEPTVRDKLEETMVKAQSPLNKQGSFFTMNDMENTISDSDMYETMSAQGHISGRDEKFMNIMEILNDPSKQPDLLTTLNDFFSSNLTTISNMMKVRKLHHTVSKTISTDSFQPYLLKLGKVRKANNRSTI